MLGQNVPAKQCTKVLSCVLGVFADRDPVALEKALPSEWTVRLFMREMDQLCNIQIGEALCKVGMNTLEHDGTTLAQEHIMNYTLSFNPDSANEHGVEVKLDLGTIALPTGTSAATVKGFKDLLEEVRAVCEDAANRGAIGFDDINRGASVVSTIATNSDRAKAALKVADRLQEEKVEAILELEEEFPGICEAMQDEDNETLKNLMRVRRVTCGIHKGTNLCGAFEEGFKEVFKQAQDENKDCNIDENRHKRCITGETFAC